jgi:hypothetical protein
MSMQRLDHAYAEILQEVRVAQTGVQVVLAFVLTLAFTPQFKDLSTAQLGLYIATLVLGSAAASLLIAPAALNRLVFRQRLRHNLVNAANRFALTGLTLLVATIGCALLLILQVVLDSSGLATVLAVALACWFLVIWFAIPAWWRFRHRECGPDRVDPAEPQRRRPYVPSAAAREAMRIREDMQGREAMPVHRTLPVRKTMRLYATQQIAAAATITPRPVTASAHRRYQAP